MKLEEQKAVNRYLLNLKKLIGIQITLLKPVTITEAQAHAAETEMWIRESQPTRITTPKTVMTSKFIKPQVFIPTANTTSNGIPNENLPLLDRTKMNCNMCGRIGHLANQCYKQGFQVGQNIKIAPQPIRIIQEEETEKEWMTQEEIKEQSTYEESAEYQLLAADLDQSMQKEEPENTDYWLIKEQQ